MNKEILTLEGVTRIKNFTDKKVIEANRFSQEIITDGEIIEKGEQRISPFADENKKYMEKISEVSKRGAYELIKHDYSIEKATYIIKIYYENLRYMDYFGEIKDVEVYILDDKKSEALAVAEGDNLSLAIGKKGQNVKLAARLTKCKIDVKTREQVQEEGINIYKYYEA